MMERIFPRLDNMGRDAEFESEWRKVRRAASPEMFPNYFQFAVGADRLSCNSMIPFIEGLADQDETEATLLDAVRAKRSDGSSEARDYLEYFRDYANEIDPSRAINMLRVLAKIGDRLIVKGDEPHVGVSLPVSVRLGWVMQYALTRIPEHQRDGELIASFRAGGAMTYLCEAISMIESCHQKPVTYGPAATLTALKPATIIELKAIAIAWIELAAVAGHLITAPEMVSLLIRWRDWRSIDAPRTWIAENILPDRKKLLCFLEHFLRSSTTTAIGDLVGRVSYSLGLKFLSDFIDLAEVDGRLAQVVKGERLTDSQKLVIATFQRQYKIFTKGKDPDSLMMRMGIDDED
jgi:predicted KAP-like P-loop ATPase